jgi:hypothetical protein
MSALFTQRALVFRQFLPDLLSISVQPAKLHLKIGRERKTYQPTDHKIRQGLAKVRSGFLAVFIKYLGTIHIFDFILFSAADTDIADVLFNHTQVIRSTILIISIRHPKKTISTT